MTRFILLILFLAASLPALADLRSELRAVFKTSAGEVVEDRPLVSGLWNEPFVDPAVFFKMFAEAFDGEFFPPMDDEHASFQRALQQSLRKMAFSDSTIMLQQGGAYDYLEIQFKVSSDRDPLAKTRVFLPRGLVGIQASSAEIFSPRSQTQRFRIYPRLLPHRDYALATFTKERDCRSCLAVVHSVRLIILNPGARREECQKAVAELDLAQASLNHYFFEKRALINSLNTEKGPLSHLRINELKDSISSTSAPSEGRGLCDDRAFGIDSYGTCEALREIDELIPEWTQKRNYFAKAMSERCRDH